MYLSTVTVLKKKKKLWRHAVIKKICCKSYFSLSQLTNLLLWGGSSPFGGEHYLWGSENCLNLFSFYSDLVNGLVALMNSNVSSPVNLVSMSASLY